MNEPGKGAPAYPMQSYVYPVQDDEINLVDIWVALLDYRKVFLATFTLVLILGLLFALFVFQEKRSLVTVVQIGTFAQDGKTQPIESPESLLAKINQSIVPRLTGQWVDENELKGAFKTTVENPKGSEIISITNTARESDLEMYSRYQQTVAEYIVEDHRRLINSYQARLKSSLELALLKLRKLENPLELNIQLKSSQINLETEQDKLKRLQDENFFGIRKNEFQNQIVTSEHELELLKKAEVKLQQQVDRIDENKKILSRNIKELTDQIKVDRLARDAAQKEGTELSAMSLLMLGNESQQNHNRLLSLEERYFVTLENEKADVLSKIEANRLQIVDVEKKINVLKQKFDQMLIENQLQIDQQNLVVEKAKLNIEQIKFNHDNEIASQKQSIQEIKTRLDNYNETRIVSPPIPSLNTAGLSRSMLIVLVAFLAAFAGFFAMLMAMFSDKVKQRRLEISKQNA